MYRMGSGYFGSDTLKTSTANIEIIQQHKPVTMNELFEAYKFSFMNYSTCTVKINGSSNALYLREGQGFCSEMCDLPIYSFIIVTAGITYNYIGAY